MVFSGIITTILGKTATNSKDAGRERRVHHSKSLPLPFTGERLFFRQLFHLLKYSKIHIKQVVICKFRASSPGRQETCRCGTRARFSQCCGAGI